jgi:hypothetical protein
MRVESPLLRFERSEKAWDARAIIERMKMSVEMEISPGEKRHSV